MDGRSRVALSILLGVMLASTIMIGLTSTTTPQPQAEQDIAGVKGPEERSLAMNVTPPQKRAEAESTVGKVESSIFIDQAKVGLPFAVALAAGIIVFAVAGRRIS